MNDVMDLPSHLDDWIGRKQSAREILTPRLVDGLLATLDHDTLPWCTIPIEMATDPAARKIGTAFYQYLDKAEADTRISEHAYLKTRDG